MSSPRFQLNDLNEILIGVYNRSEAWREDSKSNPGTFDPSIGYELSVQTILLCEILKELRLLNKKDKNEEPDFDCID